MAKLTHQSNFNTAAFGQHGSAHLDTLNTDLTCPTGKVFVAITMLEDTTFNQLEAVDNGTTGGSFGSDGTDNDYDGKGNFVTTSTIFPKGLTIYGEWDTIDIASGKIIAYWGPAN
jgi:hypothetical protein